jgi:hypothetical protein
MKQSKRARFEAWMKENGRSLKELDAISLGVLAAVSKND